MHSNDFTMVGEILIIEDMRQDDETVLFMQTNQGPLAVHCAKDLHADEFTLGDCVAIKGRIENYRDELGEMTSRLIATSITESSSDRVGDNPLFIVSATYLHSERIKNGELIMYAFVLDDEKKEPILFGFHINKSELSIYPFCGEELIFCGRAFTSYVLHEDSKLTDTLYLKANTVGYGVRKSDYE